VPRIDRIAEPWGTRTPYGPEQTWPTRVDTYLADGLTEDDVDRWVQSATILDSNSDGRDIAVPGDLGGVDMEKPLACIEACVECAQSCTACADACLSEESVAELRKCVRTNLDCADICDATGRVLSRHTGYDADLTRAVLEACAAACKACGDECARHADMHEHCRVCADACRRSEHACRDLVTALG